MHGDIQHALVTGAGGGIGAAIVAALVAADIKVSLMGRRRESLDKVLDDIDRPQTSQAVTCDVACRDSVDSAISSVTKNFGPINLLVNCAGMAKTKPFHRMTNADWNDSIDVNLNGVFNCTSAVINSMRDQRFGRIVNIASTSALKGYAYVSAYCASKHAVLGLTRALALETATKGITVNAICPGGFMTEPNKKWAAENPEIISSFKDQIPAGDFGQPEDLGPLALYLASDASRYMTGASLVIDGGYVLW